MSGTVQNDGWTKKQTLKSSTALGGVGLIALLFAFFKTRHLFDPTPTVRPYSGNEQTQKHHESPTAKKTGGFSMAESITAFRTLKAGSAAGQSLAHSPVKVIERPLLDGLLVTVSATLVRSISSLEPDPSVEAVFGALIRTEETHALDDDPLRGARLIGMAIPNMDLKRMALRFSELVTREGRSYGVQAIAIDPETQTQGVVAEYSSGLGSRLVGVGISRVITAGDQILMSKLLPDSGQASVVQQVTQEAARQMNDQAANEISLETTRNLRETKAELSLPAGTQLMLRLRALPEQSSRSNSSNTTQSF